MTPDDKTALELAELDAARKMMDAARKMMDRVDVDEAAECARHWLTLPPPDDDELAMLPTFLARAVLRMHDERERLGGAMRTLSANLVVAGAIQFAWDMSEHRGHPRWYRETNHMQRGWEPNIRGDSARHDRRCQVTKRERAQVLTEDDIDTLADDGRLGVIAKRLAIEAGADWPSLDGEEQDAWHERAIDGLRSGELYRYAVDAGWTEAAARVEEGSWP